MRHTCGCLTPKWRRQWLPLLKPELNLSPPLGACHRKRTNPARNDLYFLEETLAMKLALDLHIKLMENEVKGETNEKNNYFHSFYPHHLYAASQRRKKLSQ